MTQIDFKQLIVTVYGPVVILALLIGWVYGQVLTFEFLTFDDIDYVYENAHVTGGISADSIEWAMTNVTYMCWQPLAWMSHMLDCHLFGLNAGMHHMTNVFLHLVTSMLLFVMLRTMTGAPGKSFAVALLFAMHPLGVDTVAWVSERKNLLFTSFLLLSLHTYFLYVRDEKKGFYALSLLFFIAGFFAKPAIVTLPCLLLLVDIWPLDRFNLSQRGTRVAKARLLLEKLPFFILSGAYLMFFKFMLGKMYPTPPAVSVPLGLKVSNALTSYVHYLKDFFWPFNLAVYYPFPASVPTTEAVLALVYMVIITVAVLLLVKKHAYFLVGWFWFVGTLVPTIGILQAGLWPARADRWMYMPMIGILLVLVWGVGELTQRLSYRKVMAVVVTSAVVALLGTTSRLQTTHWRNTLTLFQRAASVTRDNFVAYNEIGLAQAMKGQFHEASVQFENARLIQPRYWKPYLNLGAIHLLNGKTDMAIEHFNTALKINPNSPRLYNNMGRALLSQKRYKEAAANFQKALDLNPNDPTANSNLEKIAPHLP